MQTAAWQKHAPLPPSDFGCSQRLASTSSLPQQLRSVSSRVACRSQLARRSACCASAKLSLSPAPSSNSFSCSHRQHRCCNRLQPAAAAVTSADASTDTGLPELPIPDIPVRGKGLGSLALRVIFGSVLGAAGAIVITAGGWLFTSAVCLVAYQATQEFFGFIYSKNAAEGHSPPSRIVTALTTVLCLGLSIWSHITNGRATAALAVASFAVLAVHVSLTKKPTIAQLASAVFGLFYCGYLPSFWVKLRLLSAPAVNSQLVHDWPVLFGGLSHWTVGLVATLLAVLCVIAADTGAFFCGKSFGRTQLTEISPKKTVEGAAGGLVCSVITAMGFWRVFAWPADPLTAVVLGMLCFVASLFGDLIESVMKRDAGVKDASNLIPGHGGLLDRFDSYLFTGAIVFFFVKFVFPLFGL